MSIKATNIQKVYGSRIIALENVNLNIEKGIFGLLGRNGAGKTTLMRILTSLLDQSRGSVEICNIELNKKNIYEIKKIIGYLPQDFNFYGNLNVREALDYTGMLCKMRKSDRENRIEETLKMVNLEKEKKKKVRQLSGGMLRRLGIAHAIFNEPKVLIVDEPTSGVDPQERIAIRNILSEFSENHTVLLSSHIVEDIASTCKQIMILDNGKVAYDGELKTFIKSGQGSVWKANLQSSQELNSLKQQYHIVSTQYLEDSIEVKILSRTRPTIPCVIIEPNIEDAYMLLLQERGDSN